MKKEITALLSIFMLCATSSVLFAQESGGEQTDTGNGQESGLLESYQRNFARGNLSTKMKILRDAGESGQEMGKLYMQAVDFYLDNINSLRSDSTAIELARVAVELIGKEGYRQERSRLWSLFKESDHPGLRIAIMHSFGEILEAEDALVSDIIGWMEMQNGSYRKGKTVDEQILGETINTLGKIGSSKAFKPIFNATVLGYSKRVSERAKNALEKLEGDIAELIITLLEDGYPQEKLEVLEWAMKNEDLSKKDKGRIATIALEVGLARYSAEEETQKLKELRYSAARYLTELEWSEATSVAIEHFNETISEIDTGTGSPSNLLEAIALLGAMGTHEAAVRLSLYLEVINSYVENGRRVNEQVVLATIKNLGKLGDEVAFDQLLFVKYLDEYPRRIKQAAQEVLQKLR